MYVDNNLFLNNKIQSQDSAATPQKSGVQYVGSNFSALNSSALAPVFKSQAMNLQPAAYRELGVIKIPYSNNIAKLYQLNNGQRVIIMPKEGPTTINTYVKVGSMNEPDHLRGISHYIEHNLFNGSSKLQPGEFVKKVNEIGGQYNASTGFATTNYYIKTTLQDQKSFDEILNIHSDMLQHPSFTQDMLDKEKGPVMSEIQMLEDEPNVKLNNIVLKNLFQINSSSVDLIGGSVGKIKNITRNDVVDYYNLYYTPDNMTTVLVGDVNPDEAIQKLSYSFNSFKKSNPAMKQNENLNPIQKPSRVDITCPTIKSTLVNLAFAGPQNGDAKGTLAMNLLIQALSGSRESRMNKALGPYNTVASMAQEVISSDYNSPTSVMLATSLDTGKTEDALKSIYQAIYSMQTTPLSAQEMLIAKNNLKHELKNISESSMMVTRFIGGNLVNSNSFAFCDLDRMIDELTPQDIMNTARTFLDLNKVSIGMMHPQQQTAPAQNAVSFGSASKINFEGAKLSQSETYNLSNNIQAVYNTNNDTTLAAFDLDYTTDDYVKTKPAVPFLLQNMLKEGSTKRSKDEFYSISDTNSINFDFGVSQKGIQLAVNTDAEKADLALDLMNEVLNYPVLTENNLKKAKDELKIAYSSSPEDPFYKALEELYPNDPRGNNLRKAVETLDNVTLDDVKNFYYSIFSNSKANSAISAPDSVKTQTLQKLSTMIGATKPYYYKPLPKTESLKNNVVITEAQEKNQAHIVQSFKFDETGNIKDVAALTLLNLILGGNSSSRLFNDLREKQKLAYYVSSAYSSNLDNGMLSMEILTTTEDQNSATQSFDNIQKSIDGFKAHINDLIQNPVSDSELENAKTTYLNKISFLMETNAGKADAIASSMNTYYGKGYIEELEKAIKSTTKEDIQKIAKCYLSSPSVTSIIASKKTLEENKNYLATLGQVKNI